MRDRDRLVVDVEHPRPLAGGQVIPDDLVDVADRRHTGAEVDELADARFQSGDDRAVHEGTVLPRDRLDLGHELLNLLAEFPVDRPVVAATEVPVVHAGGGRLVGVDACRGRGGATIGLGHPGP